MSLKASTWAWSVPAGTKGISPALKLLLVALADFADDGGRCWPSVPRLAAMTGLGERSVRRLLPDLVAAGLVAVEHQQGRNNRYTLQVGSTPEPRPYGQGCHTGRGVNGTPVEMAPHPGHTGTPATVAPLPMTPETPARVAPEPLRTVSRVEPPFSPPQAGNEKTSLPDWLPMEWNEWETYRTVVAPRTWTPQVRRFSIASLDALRQDGHDPAKVIRQAIAGGFTAFRPLPQPPAGRRETVAGYFARVGSLQADDFADLDDIKPPRRLQ